jgi:hypothetical protein
VVPRPLPHCAPQVLDRGSQADARGAAQVLGRGAQAVARGAARCASQVLGRGAQAFARGAATLPQQEKNNSADVQRSKVNIFRLYMCSGKLFLRAMYLRRFLVVGRSFVTALTHISTFVTPPAPAAKKLGAGLRRHCRGQALHRRKPTRMINSGIEYILPALPV